jgi:flagellin-specific chaperone FliS
MKSITPQTEIGNMHNNTPLQAYRQQSARSWTRIDLLLALYDAGIQALEAGATALRAGDERAARRHRSRTQRVLIEILDGLNPDFPETTGRIRQLALCVLSCVTGADPSRWDAAARILSTLRSAYDAVRSDALSFEEQLAVSACRDGHCVSELV